MGTMGYIIVSYQSNSMVHYYRSTLPWGMVRTNFGEWVNLTITGTYKSLSHTVCPPLSLGNGTVSYSMEMGVERNVGSVATHTCISGYRLLMQDGENTRTCNMSGWNGQDFICGE